jgi:hypothetical protein
VEARSHDSYDISARGRSPFIVQRLAPLDAPSGIRPDDGHVIDRTALRRSRALTLGWYNVRDANAYVITIWRESKESPLLRTSYIERNSYIINDVMTLVQGAEVTTIHWQVEAVMLGEDSGLPERIGEPTVSSFVIDVAPPKGTTIIDTGDGG